MSATAENVFPAEGDNEQLINQVLNNTPVLAEETPEDPTIMNAPAQVLWAFCVDCAQNIQKFEQIALRYGFGNTVSLHKFLLEHRPIRKRIKELRAVWESDGNVEVRVRKLAQHALLEALPGTAAIMMNTRSPDSVRMDAFSRHAKVAGVDGNPYAGGRGSNNAPGVGRFSVSINFANAGRIENFTTVEGKVEAAQADAIESDEEEEEI